MYVKLDEKGEVAQYPYSATDLIRSMPEVSWPSRPLTDEEMAEFGVLPVSPTSPPPAEVGREAVEIKPAFSNGRWWQRWQFVDKRQPSHDEIDDERDRRLNNGIVFEGNTFQTDRDSRENINGASTFSVAAIMGGAQPGDYRWNGSSEDFEWLTVDNKRVAMDAQTMLQFGMAMANRKAKLIWAARTLKDTDPVPFDYWDDKYWP